MYGNSNHLTMVALTAVLCASSVHASPIGETVEGNLTIFDINDGTAITMGGDTNVFTVPPGALTTGSGSPVVIGAGPDFFVQQLNAGAYGGALDQFLDITVDVMAAGFSVAIGGNFLSDVGGIIPAFDITLENIDWFANPGGMFTGVTAVSTEFSSASVTFNDNSLSLSSSQFNAPFLGPDSYTNEYSFVAADDNSQPNAVPVPATAWLLILGLAGVAGAKRLRHDC